MKEYLQIVGILFVMLGPPILFYYFANRHPLRVEEIDDERFEKFWLLRRFTDQAPAGSVSKRRLDWLEDRESTRIFPDKNTIIWETYSRTFILIMRVKWDRTGQVKVEGRIAPPSLTWLVFPVWFVLLLIAGSYFGTDMSLSVSIGIGFFFLLFLLVVFSILALINLVVEWLYIRKMHYPTMKNFLWPGRKK
ncbi:MAG: hypothetical protein H6646_10825 [Anaerolineales bacterium]|nr:hypothetical protein [Anaerolineales bacterium]MCB9142748.1 hypothetical protein [Anaerolineales bacterium]MCO5243213.1 hypothetical protein [Anaerolineae bacterium]